MRRMPPIWSAGTIAVLCLLLAGCSQPASDPQGPAPPPEGTSSSTSAPAPTTDPARPEKPADQTRPQQALTISAEGFYPVNPSFGPSEATVEAGAEVTLTYVNNDLNPLGKHDWFLEGVGAQTDLIDVGESTEIIFLAPAPGDYAYYCAVDTHRERGMEGVLHVTG